MKKNTGITTRNFWRVVNPSLFRKARKSLMTTDNDMGQFRAKLDELIAGKDGLSDEEVVAKVDELKGFAADLPDSEDKAELDRYLEDFKSIKGLDEAVAKKAAEMVADLFEKLDTEAMKEHGRDEDFLKDSEVSDSVSVSVDYE